MTLSENIYEPVLTCVISGRLVALRKVLSSRNNEERGDHIKGGWASRHGPGDLRRGEAEAVRPRAPVWCWLTTSGERRVQGPRRGSACSQAHLVSRVCPRRPLPPDTAFLFLLLPAQQPATACVQTETRAGAEPACRPLLPAWGAQASGSSLSGRTPPPLQQPQEFPHRESLQGQTLPMITSQGPGTWSACPRCPCHMGLSIFCPQTPALSCLCGSPASLFPLEARLDSASSSDAPTVRICGPVSGEGERREVVLGPWEHDPPV